MKRKIREIKFKLEKTVDMLCRVADNTIYDQEGTFRNIEMILINCVPITTMTPIK